MFSKLAARQIFRVGSRKASSATWKSFKANEHNWAGWGASALAVGAAAIAVVDFPTARAEGEEESGASLARRNSMRRQKKHYPFVIVGGGTTALAAIEAIRQGEPEADILILSEEPALPRVDLESETQEPLSDELLDTYNEWRRHITSRLENEPDTYSSGPVTLLLGHKDMHFDVENNQILLQDGTEVHYDKCLIASAGQPRDFYVLDGSKVPWSLRHKINTLQTEHDFAELDNLSKSSEVSNVTVIGGGFLGTELASALATNPRFHHLKVQQIFVENAPLYRYLPLYLAECISRRLRAKGVELISDKLVTALRAIPDEEDPRLSLSLMGDETSLMESDYVVLASTHIDPKVKIARESGLEIDPKNGGIVVNAQLEAMSGLYVAGNAASFYDPALGRRRVDMYDHAVNSGLQAGLNMVAEPGKSKFYTHQPMFRSSMPGIGVLLEGLGKVDGNLRTVGVFMAGKNASKEREERTRNSEFSKGVVYYLQGSKVVGILLWNASDVLEQARMVLNKQPLINNVEDLKNQISLGPDEWLDIIVTDRSRE